MTHSRSGRGGSADPQLSALLRALSDEPPVQEVDWSALRSSVRARAELPLARRRRGAGGPHRTWLRPLVPLTAAASLIFGLWIGGNMAPDSSGVAVAGLPAQELQLAEELLHAEMSELEFQLYLSGASDPEGLLLIAIGDRER